MYHTSGTDNSSYGMETQEYEACPWMQPLLLNVQTNTCFTKPITNEKEVSFERSVRVLAQPRGKDGSIKKNCNFIYTPGNLFNRRIVYE